MGAGGATVGGAVRGTGKEVVEDLVERGVREFAETTAERAAREGAEAAARSGAKGGIRRFLGRSAEIAGAGYLLNSIFGGSGAGAIVKSIGGGLLDGLGGLFSSTTGSGGIFDSVMKLSSLSNGPSIASVAPHTSERKEYGSENVNLLSSDNSMAWIAQMLRAIYRTINRHSEQLKSLDVEVEKTKSTSEKSIAITKVAQEENAETATILNENIKKVGKTVAKTDSTMSGILKAIKPTSVSDSWNGYGAASVSGGAGGGPGGGPGGGSGNSIVGNLITTGAALLGAVALPARWVSDNVIGGEPMRPVSEDAPPLVQDIERNFNALDDSSNILMRWFEENTTVGAWIKDGILWISDELGELIDRVTRSTWGSSLVKYGLDIALTTQVFQTIIYAAQSGLLAGVEGLMRSGKIPIKLGGGIVKCINILSEFVKIVNHSVWDLTKGTLKLIFRLIKNHSRTDIKSLLKTLIRPRDWKYVQQIRNAINRSNRFMANRGTLSMGKNIRETVKYGDDVAKKPSLLKRAWNRLRGRPNVAGGGTRVAESAGEAAARSARTVEAAVKTGAESADDVTRTVVQSPKPTGAESTTSPAQPAQNAKSTSTRTGDSGRRPVRHRSPRRPGAQSTRPPRTPTPVASPSPVGASTPPNTAAAKPQTSTVVKTRGMGGFWSAMKSAARVAGRVMTGLLAGAAAIDSLRLGYLSGVRLDLFGDNAYSFGLGGLKGNPTWQERLDNSRTLVERHANPFGHDFFADLFQQMDDAFAGIIKAMYLQLQNFFKENKISQQKIDEITQKLNQNCFTFYQDKYGLKRLNKYWNETGNAPFLPMFRVGADKTVEDNYANRWGSSTKQSKSLVAFGDAIINPATDSAEFLFVNIPGFLARHTFWSDESIDNWEADAQKVTGVLTGKADIQNSLESYYQQFTHFLCQYLEKDLLKEFFVEVDPSAESRGKNPPIRRIPEDPNELADILEIQNALAKSGSNPSSITYWPKSIEGHRLLSLVKSGAIDASTLETIRSEAQAGISNGSPFRLKEANDHYTFLALNQRIQPKNNTPAFSVSTTSTPNGNENQDTVSPTTTRATPGSPYAARRGYVNLMSEDKAHETLARDSRTIESIEEGVDTLLARTEPPPKRYDTPDGGYMVS